MRKNAFTLEEVLITLAIVGIVAAMTIPTLITKYKERVLVNKVKEAHSLLMNAVQLYIAKNYCINSLCLFDTNKTSDKVAYAMGKRYKAGSDNKYEIVLELAKKDEEGKATAKSLVSLTVDDFIHEIVGDPQITYKDEEKTEEDEMVYFDVEEKINTLPTVYDGMSVEGIYVVNTSGSLVKSKSKCTDGDDYIIKVSGFDIEKIYEELD